MKTVDIKGRPYITVNERLKEFRNTHKDYALVTEIVELNVDNCTMKATIIDDKGVIRATGYAREVVAKSPINKYAFVENCETSAVGRCLGNFGIGIDDAVCTADELILKLSQEDKSNVIASEARQSQETKEKPEFEKRATAEKSANTRALTKAKETGEYVKPTPKGTVKERFEMAISWINGLEEWSPTPAQRDSLNNLCADLFDAGFEDEHNKLCDLIRSKDNLDDGVPY